MKKRKQNYLIGFAIFLIQYCGFSQSGNVYIFQPLAIVDTITNQKTINDIRIKDEVKHTPFFFSENYLNERGLFLFEKKDNHWIVYSYNDFVSNFSITKHESHSTRYVSIGVRATRSGAGQNVYGWLVLFDLEQKTYIVLDTFAHNTGEGANGNDTYRKECSSEVRYLNGNLHISRKCDTNKADLDYCENCTMPGIYKIFDNRLLMTSAR